jgi:hypothetical protein
MTTLQSQVFSSITSDNISINEFNRDSLTLQQYQKANGLYVEPSSSVPGRASIVGYVLTATDENGKVEWGSGGNGTLIPGKGTVWFSDATGRAIGNNTSFVWDDDNDRLAIGTNAPQVELDVRGTMQAQNLSVYDQADINKKIVINAPLLPTSYTITLPPNSGTNGYALTTDGNGITTWEPQTGGGDTVTGLGRVWFSNAAGSPVGTNNLVWNGANLTVGANLVIRGTTFTNTIIPSSTQTLNTSITLPPNNGTNGYVLTTDGAGITTWTVKSTGGNTVAGEGSIWFSDATGDPIGDVTKLIWSTGNNSLDIKGALRFENTANATTTIKSSELQLTNVILTLPIAYGAANTVLTTDAAGVLSWTSKGGGAITVGGLGTIWVSNAGGSPVQSTTFEWIETSKTLKSGKYFEMAVGAFVQTITAGAIAEDLNLILPVTKGTTGNILSTDGAGTLSWVPASSVSGPTDKKIWFSDINSLATGSAKFTWDTDTILLDGYITFINTLDATATTLVLASTAQATGTTLNFILPATAGTTGQMLVTNGAAGQTSWETPPAGGDTVAGEGKVWYSNATGNPIGNDNIKFAGTSLTLGAATATGTLSAAFIDVRSGTTVFTTSLSSGVQSANLTLILPIDSGSAGQLLATDGAGVLTWETVTGAIPAGLANEIQFKKNATEFDASANLTFSGTTLTVSDAAVTNNGLVKTDTLDVGALANPFKANYDGTATGTSFTATGKVEGSVVVINNTTNTTTLAIGTQAADLTLTLPTAYGAAGTVLSTDAAGVLSWVVSTVGAAGADTQIQFNDGGTTIGADSGLTYTKGTTVMTVGTTVIVNGAATGGSITATKFTATSDSRLKSNITPLVSGFDYLGNIGVYSYNMKDSEELTYGVIAQDLDTNEHLRNLVTDNSNGYKSVDYMQLIPLLIQKVNDLEKEIKNIKQQWT